MKVKKFKKQIDAISEIIANPSSIELGITAEDAEKYLKVLDKAKDLVKENKQLKERVEELEYQVALLDYATEYADGSEDYPDDEEELDL